MEIIITQWALDSYLNLRGKFTNHFFSNVIRPDVILLKQYPHDAKFSLVKFWSNAQDKSGNNITNGYKMKWHQVGNGKVQLRLPIDMFN